MADCSTGSAKPPGILGYSGNGAHLLQGGAGHVLQQRAVLPHLVGQLVQLPLLEWGAWVYVCLCHFDSESVLMRTQNCDWLWAEERSGQAHVGT
jgi:hypothetical protein